MKFDHLTTAERTPFKGPLVLTPKVFDDERGFFFESWNQNTFDKLFKIGDYPSVSFVQDNHSRSSVGVLRGLHFQVSPNPQGKLIRCVVGEIFDVAVDLRIDSSSFAKWIGVKLSASNHKELWVPEGFAHGFLTLSQHAEVLYKTTDYWKRDCERSIRWDDPKVGITWPNCGAKIQLSEKDSKAPFLDDYQDIDLF